VSAVTTPIRPSAMLDSVPFGDSRIGGSVPPTILSGRRHRAIYVVWPVLLIHRLGRVRQDRTKMAAQVSQVPSFTAQGRN
jgi:hypothetical protein